MVNLPHLDNVLPLARLLKNAGKSSQNKQFIIKAAGKSTMISCKGCRGDSYFERITVDGTDDDTEHADTQCPIGNNCSISWIQTGTSNIGKKVKKFHSEKLSKWLSTELKYSSLNVIFLIEDKYTFATERTCNGFYGRNNLTLNEAKIACSKDINCAMIVDKFCDGGGYTLCYGPFKADTLKRSCTFVKGNYHSQTFM